MDNSNEAIIKRARQAREDRRMLEDYEAELMHRETLATDEERDEQEAFGLGR